jgi:hypothetical protein
MRKPLITRSEVHALVEEARAQKKNKAAHVRGRLEEQYPDLKGQTVRRNGFTYDAIEYLMGDIESYGKAT